MDYEIAIPEHKVPANEGFLDDIMTVGAGGCEDWALVTVQEEPDSSAWTSITLELHDPEDGHEKTYRVTYGTLIKGIEVLLKDWPKPDAPRDYHAVYPSHAMQHDWVYRGVIDDDATMIDSIVGETIIQYGLWGKVVYS